jgi:hypothetical protein
MKKKENLFDGGWMLLIIFCTFVCIMMIVIFPFDKNKYQEECVQSHVEYNETKRYGEPQYAIFDGDNVTSPEVVDYNYGGASTLKINYKSRTLWAKIETVKTPIEVCDKYALVRYAEVKE